MRRLLLFCLVSSVLFTGCPKDDDKEETSSFDVSAMLTNYADNLIIPAYNDLKTSTTNLQTAIVTFNANPSEANLLLVQEKWVLAYKDWQYCNAYHIGPAKEQGLIKTLGEEIATFPASETKIEGALTAPNFSDFNRDARGFLALEYLIYKGTAAEIVAKFSDDNRKNYLAGIVSDILSRVNSVINTWNASYRSEFIASTGSGAGSSTSNLYNEFLKSFENIKNLKLELPLGKRPGQTQAEPQLVEAYYSGQSLVFLQAHIQAIENIYYGKTKAGVDNLGLVDRLKSVDGGSDLATTTLNQWSQVKATLNTISSSTALSDQVVNSPTSMTNLAIELQKQTRYFKSDMSSLLGIAITYSSGDGD